MDAEGCYEALMSAQDLPYGQARSTLVEQVVAEADKLGDRELAIDARMELQECYLHGGEQLKQFPVFAWLLARHDEEPFEDAQLWELLWGYKTVACGTVDHPDVPLAVVTGTLEDLHRRFVDAGEGLAPVLGCRFEVTEHLHGAQAAHEAYLEWVRAPRTDLSDCAGCEPTTRVDHLVALGRHADAVAEAFSFLADGEGCDNQPGRIIAASLASMLVTGHAARAATEHVRSVRQIRRDPNGAYRWATHLDVLTRAGRLNRAADLLAERLHNLDSPHLLHGSMFLAAAGAAVASRLDAAGRGDVVVAPRRPSTLVPGPVAAAELVQPLTTYALDLAARYDARNRTSAIGDRVRAVLDPQPLPDLPLDGLGGADEPRRRARRAAAPAAVGASAPLAGSAGGASGNAAASDAGGPVTLDGLAADLAASRDSGVAAQHAAVVRAWREHGERLRAEVAAGDVRVARLDWSLAITEAERDSSRLPSLLDRGRALLESGDLGGAARAEQWWLREAVRAGLMDPQEALDRAGDALARGAGTLPPAAFAWVSYLFLGVMQVCAEAIGGEEARETARQRARDVVASGLATLDRVALGDLSGNDRGGYAALLRIGSQLTEDQAERRSLLARAFDLLPAGTRCGQRAEIAVDCAGLFAEDGDVDAALALFAGAEPDAVAAGERELAAHVADSVAQLLLGLAEARGEAEESVPAADPAADAEAGSAADPAAGSAEDSAAGSPEDETPDDLLAGAVAAALRAVGHAEALGQGLALDQARRSLVRALQAAGRTLEAAEVAELAFLDAANHLVAEGLRPADEPDGWPEHARDTAGPRLDVHVAGALGWAAATAAQQLGERSHAHALAVDSARWHVANANAGAAAESLQIAAETAEEADTAARLWGAVAAACERTGSGWGVVAALRGRLLPLAAATGTEAGLAAAKELHGRIDEVARADADDPDAATRATWEHCVVEEQTAKILADDGQLAEALAVTDGLADRYRALGDFGSVWDVASLRGRLLIWLERFEEGEALLRAAIEEAAERAPGRAARLADVLADELEDVDRDDEADELRERFGLE